MNLTNALLISDYQCDERTAELNWLAEQASYRHKIAEVGSYKGCTARVMADNTNGKVYCIDTFAGSVGEADMARLLAENGPNWLYDTCRNNLSGLGNVIIMRMDSIAAAKELSQGHVFDMIFLDASHDYDSVKADLLAWMPLLRPGGLLCGHDRQWDGVAKAIDELVPDHRVGVGAIWYRQ